MFKKLENWHYINNCYDHGFSVQGILKVTKERKIPKKGPNPEDIRSENQVSRIKLFSGALCRINGNNPLLSFAPTHDFDAKPKSFDDIFSSKSTERTTGFHLIFNLSMRIVNFFF